MAGGFTNINDNTQGISIREVKLAIPSNQLMAIEKAFARSFLRAQENGELDAGLCPDELAARVMTINLGLRVQSRLRKSQKELVPMIESSLSMLGLAA